MSKRLSKDQVLHIAKLASLKLSSAEIDKFRVQLSDILDYVNMLGKVNTNGVKPTSQVTGLENITRPDKKEKCLTQDKALSQTKNKQDGYFKVKPTFQP